MASFSADITEFVKKTKLKGETVLKKLAFDGFAGVVKKTPVDTGRLRANWRLGVNTPDLSTTAAPEGAKPGAHEGSPQEGDPLSGTEEGKASTELAAVKWGDAIYITNNLPYAGYIEDGTSKQAPHGMVKRTILELKADLEKNLVAVKNL